MDDIEHVEQFGMYVCSVGSSMCTEHSAGADLWYYDPRIA